MPVIRSSESCPSRLGKMVDRRCHETYDAAAARLSCRRMARTHLHADHLQQSGRLRALFLSISRPGERRLSTRGRALGKRTHRAGEQAFGGPLTSPTDHEGVPCGLCHYTAGPGPPAMPCEASEMHARRGAIMHVPQEAILMETIDTIRTRCAPLEHRTAPRQSPPRLLDQRRRGWHAPVRGRLALGAALGLDRKSVV